MIFTYNVWCIKSFTKYKLSQLQTFVVSLPLLPIPNPPSELDILVFNRKVCATLC